MSQTIFFTVFIFLFFLFFVRSVVIAYGIMGIRNFAKRVSLVAFDKKSLENKIILFDASMLLYEKKSVKDIIDFIKRISKKYNFFPFLVLDGKINPAKKRTRKKKRVKNIRSKRRKLVVRLRELGIPYIISYMEADHQMAHMVFKFFFFKIKFLKFL